MESKFLDQDVDVMSMHQDNGCRLKFFGVGGGLVLLNCIALAILSVCLFEKVLFSCIKNISYIKVP